MLGCTILHSAAVKCSQNTFPFPREGNERNDYRFPLAETTMRVFKMSRPFFVVSLTLFSEPSEWLSFLSFHCFLIHFSKHFQCSALRSPNSSKIRPYYAFARNLCGPIDIFSIDQLRGIAEAVSRILLFYLCNHRLLPLNQWMNGTSMIIMSFLLILSFRNASKCMQNAGRYNFRDSDL